MFQNNTANDDGGVIFQVKELTPPFMCCLLLYKTVLIIRVYKSWLLNSFLYFNTVVFTIFTWYTFDDPGKKNKEVLQRAAAYISLLLSFMCTDMAIQKYTPSVKVQNLVK